MAQALFLAAHELAHGLFFASARLNQAFALFVNVPLLVPFVAAFREYHLLHHAHQGVRGVDTDLPTHLELAWMEQGVASRLCWLACQLACYALRPLLVRPLAPSRWMVWNVVTQTVALFVLGIVWPGWGGVRFLAASLLLAGGLHPCAGHFVAEHTLAETTTTQDTYSYYGMLNWLTWNVGYHVEHHDLPRVPGSRLPHVRRIAPECYSMLLPCPSWTGALLRHVRTTPRRLVNTPIAVEQ